MSDQPLSIEFIGAGDWNITGARVLEGLNDPYLARIYLSNADETASADSLIGTDCELKVTRDGREQRVLGICTASRQADERHQQANARIVVEPALAALRKRRNTKIFQEMSVPDILADVLGAGLGAFNRSARQDLTRTYPLREYTVQYQETDFDFVHRLMEEEGILYWFEHEGSTEEMVLVDNLAQHPDYQGTNGALLDYTEYDVGGGGVSMPEAVHRFEWVAQLSGNKVATRHFDWTHPATPHAAEEAGGDGPEMEIYLHDAPVTLHSYASAYGAHNTTDQTSLHKELQARDAKTADGSSSALRLRPGCKFELNGHLRVDLNKAYVVVRVEHSYMGMNNMPELEGLAYSNRFFCLPGETQWRPARSRNRSRIHGMITATVVGPGGEEIHTDMHGRVKVQFHWDRLGSMDDKSSCWLRVMQALGGGAGWGFSFIPRIGMEVLVTFIHGDPDRPLVTGAVYNTQNPPPYDYPAEKTKTTIKTNSSLGGGGFNELRFEDLAGEEEIFLHGQKDWNTIILNDHTRKVYRDETEWVGRDRVRTVDHDETVTIHHDKFKTIDNNETNSVGVDRSRMVGNNETIQIGVDRNETIGANQTESVGANQTTTIGANQTETIGANNTRTVGANETISVASNRSISVGGNTASTVGGGSTASVAASSDTKIGASESTAIVANKSLSVGESSTINVGASLTQSVGASETLTTAIARTLTVGMAETITVGAARTITTGLAHTRTVGAMDTVKVIGNQDVSVGMDRTVTVDGTYAIVCGEAKITIDGDNITLETPSDITIKAGGKLTLSGAGGVDLTSPATTIIKGEPVNIN